MSPRRLWITGSAGAGKSTLARRLADRLTLPRTELDSLFHGPNWTPADPDDFRTAVAAVVGQSEWVIDGNYTGHLGALVADRAELQIALDLPIPVVMSRVIRRTLRRMITREELWNGNTEPLRNLTRWDPQENIICWAWDQRHAYRDRAEQAEKRSLAGGLPCIRLSSAAQVRRFVRYLTSG